nr:phospholipase-like protein [Tanacetum cinerariifolium]
GSIFTYETIKLLRDVNGANLSKSMAFMTAISQIQIKITSLDLIDVIEDEEFFLKLCNEDVVRVCLLLSLEVIFMGRKLVYEFDDTLMSEYFPNLGNEFCDELNKEFIKLFEFHSGNSGSDCSDLDIDEDVDECKEEKILKEESRLRLEEEARFMREEDKLLEDENFFEKDYKKREFALMNSDHMKQAMKRVVPKKRSHCTVVTSSSWLKVSNKFKDKLQGRCAINQDMTEFCKNMKPWF